MGVVLALVVITLGATVGCQTGGPRSGAARHETVGRGYKALERNDFDTARGHFQRATHAVHSARIRGEGFLGLARCDLAEGKHQTAVGFLERARTLLVGTPATADVELLLAESCLQLSEFDRARRHLEVAFQYMPEGPSRRRSAYLLSLLHEREGTPQARTFRELAGSGDFPEYAQWRERILPPPKPSPPPIWPTPEPDRRAVATNPPVAQAVSVHARSAWGANTTGSNVKVMSNVRWITIHHTGEPTVPDLSTPSEVKAYLLRLQKSHQKHKGWADLAYHFLIDPKGGVWEGRSLRFQGAHAGSPSANEGNIGIALIGNFDETQPPRAQLQALKGLIQQLRVRYSLTANTVHTHQGLKKSAGLEFTSCPGRHLLRVLPGLLAEGPVESGSRMAHVPHSDPHPNH